MQNIDIEFASGPKAGQRIRLTDRSLVFGRTRVADIVLDWDGLISSKHFRIENQNGCFALQDLGSTNGTQINGQRVDSKVLASGDKIVVGKTTLVVRAEAVVEVDVSPAKPIGIFNPFESSVVIADHNVRPSSVPDSRANADSNKKFNPFESGIVLAKDKSQSTSESVVDSNRKFNPFESHFFKEEDLVKIIQEGDCDRTNNADSFKMEKTLESYNPGQVTNKENPTKVEGLVQLRLRVTSEIESGRKFWLALGQSSTFGRTEKADFSFGSDSSLSAEHFRVSCTAEQCDIEDLKSRGGTWLNGKQINKSILRDGDQILAGKTEFAIEIDGIAGGARLPGDIGRIETASVIAKSNNAARQVFEVTKKGYPGGIWRLRGKLPDDESFVQIIDSLHRLGAYYLLIDFSRVSIPLPKGLDCSESSLFEWLPSEAMKKSPLLYALEELVDWKLFVDEGWGCDAIIALQSELPKEELLAKLRRRLVSLSHGTEASRGILGFCWPSVLGSLLENNSNGFGKSFFDDVKLVVIEVPGKPEQWQLFGQEEAVETATKIGLRITKDTSKELEELETSS